MGLKYTLPALIPLTLRNDLIYSREGNVKEIRLSLLNWLMIQRMCFVVAETEADTLLRSVVLVDYGQHN